MDQPGKIANPARGQLNRENDTPLSPCVPENLVSRDGFSCPVPRQPAHLHTQAERMKGRLSCIIGYYLNVVLVLLFELFGIFPLQGLVLLMQLLKTAVF